MNECLEDGEILAVKGAEAELYYDQGMLVRGAW